MKELNGIKLTHNIRIMKDGCGYYAERKKFLFFWVCALYNNDNTFYKSNLETLKKNILKHYTKPEVIK